MEESQIFRIVLSSFLMPLIISGILIWFIVMFQKRKNKYEIEERDRQIREQELVIEKQQALQNERNRIAAEMHDDLGGGLTSIKFLGHKALSKTLNEENRKDISKIVNHSQRLVSNMSEIIWAMNSGFDDVENLFSYIRRYASDFLEDYNINIQFKANLSDLNPKISGEKRRHIFLIVKELLHNTVKHSNAGKVTIFLEIENDLKLIFSDDGKGYDSTKSPLGNGIKNIQYRVERLGGDIEFEANDGVKVILIAPL